MREYGPRDGNEPHFDWPLDEGERGREVWYSLVTHQSKNVAFWYRYTLLSTDKGHQEARTWAGLTDSDRDEGFFTTRSFDLSEVTLKDPFRLGFAGNELGYEMAKGSLETVADVSWEFEYEPDGVVFTPLRSEKLTDFAEKFLGSGRHWGANESVYMDGVLEVDGERYEFENAPGHQGHTVGASAPDGWSWINCNTFGEEGAVLEVLNVEGKTSVCFRRGGEVHMLNRLKHVVGPKANETVENEPGNWTLRAKGEGVKIEATVTVDDSSEWRKAAYLTPDDTSRFVAHSSLTPIEVKYRLKEEGGWSGEHKIESDSARAEWSDTSPPVGERSEFFPAEFTNG